jgi:hypothetical protein
LCKNYISFLYILIYVGNLFASIGTYCVLSEGCQVGRNISQNTVNTCIKTFLLRVTDLSTDSVSEVWWCHPFMPSSLKIPRGENNLSGIELIKEVAFVLQTSTKF